MTTKAKKTKTVPTTSRKITETEAQEIKRIADASRGPLALAKKRLNEADTYTKFGLFPKTTAVSLVSNANGDASTAGEQYWDISNPELVAAIHALVKDWHATRAKAARDEAEKLLKDLLV